MREWKRKKSWFNFFSKWDEKIRFFFFLHVWWQKSSSYTHWELPPLTPSTGSIFDMSITMKMEILHHTHNTHLTNDVDVIIIKWAWIWYIICCVLHVVSTFSFFTQVCSFFGESDVECDTFLPLGTVVIVKSGRTMMIIMLIMMRKVKKMLVKVYNIAIF